MVKIIKHSLYIWMIAATVCWAGNTNVAIQATVDQAKVPLNGRLQLEIKITGENIANLPAIIMPNIEKKLTIISKSETMGLSWASNQAVKTSKTIRLTLIPKETGVFIIEPILLEIKNKVLKTQPIKITVLSEQDIVPKQNTQQNKKRVAQQHPRNTTNSQIKNIFLSAKVNKKNIYLGEKIIYQLKLYRRIQIWNTLSVEAPEFKGFWGEDMPTEKEHIETINNQRFYVFELMKKSIYPLSEGEHSINKAKINVLINPFSGMQILETESITVNVNALPEPKPAAYKGAIGEYALHSEDNNTEKNWIVDTPHTTKITVTGDGNLRHIKQLYFKKNKALKIYKANIEDTKNEKGQNQRVFEYIIVPQDTGVHTFSGFIMTYFSLKEKNYKTITTPSYNVVIENKAVMDKKNKSELSDITYSDEEIQYIKPIELNNETTKPIQKNHIFWGIMGLNILGLGIIIIKAGAQLEIGKRTGESQQKRQLKTIKKQINQLLKKETQTAATWSKLLSLIHQIIVIKIGISNQKLTMPEIESILNEKRMPKQTAKAIIKYLEILNYVAYAPGSESNTIKTKLINQTKKIVSVLNKEL